MRPQPPDPRPEPDSLYGIGRVKVNEAYWVWTCSCGEGGLFVLVADPALDQTAREVSVQEQAAEMVQGHLASHVAHPDPERFAAQAGPVKLTGRLRKPLVTVDWSHPR